MCSLRSVFRQCLAGCLIVMMLAPALALSAKVVTYTFAGEVGELGGLPDEFPVSVGDAITGSISFYSGAALLPPRGEDDNFWAYHPTGIFHLSIGEHIWSNAQPGGKPCAVWMHFGWPQASFWCMGPDSDVGLYRMRLDFWIESPSPPMTEPHPLGPFDPVDFKTLKIGSQLNFLGDDGWVLISDPKLTDVQFTSEPGVVSLMLVIAVALPWFRRRRGTRRLPGVGMPMISVQARRRFAEVNGEPT